jgi:hypothetical protein
MLLSIICAVRSNTEYLSHGFIRGLWLRLGQKYLIVAKKNILLSIPLICKQEAWLISILVDEHGGSIDALGAKGDFFLD